MINVSAAWKDIQQRFLLPESFIEIECAITPIGEDESIAVSGTNEAVVSNIESILGTASPTKYATNELNLWALDGTRAIVPDSEPYGRTGYISDIESTGSVTLTLSEVSTAESPGMTIVWGNTYGEYPSVFTVTAKNGNTVVAETTITDNTEQKSHVYLPMANYDRVTVTVHNWGLPKRRVRIERVDFGHILTLEKKDILSYTHEQYGDLLSGELPKNSIEFTLDNLDGRWNPNNPVGMERYLSERQKLKVRYGMDVNGSVEWIKAGTFYLSEWDAPSNGFEARFVARDLFEFLIGTDITKLPNMSSTQYGPLSEVVGWATRGTLPDGASVIIDASLGQTAGREFGADGTYAEMVQKSANAACCILRFDRDGTLYVEPLNKTLTEYTITQALSYSHPEMKLSKPLKQVAVDFGGEEPYSFNVGDNGEIQTVINDYIHTADAANDVAEWVASVLKNRKTVSGEFRADPRLDLFDVVTVESKYGALTPVVITDIKYTFNGSFHGSYTGRVLEGT